MIHLAIDQSTSATKALLVDASQPAHPVVLDSVALPHRQQYPQPGHVEHDAEEIWQNTLTAIAGLTGRNPGHPPARLSLTNQRETFVLFDRSGRPTCPAIVWQCRRGTEICRELENDARDAELTRRTGLVLDTYFPASKLLHHLREHPDDKRRLESGELLFGTIDTYLIYRLTSGQVFATDATNASRTLFFNIHERAWDERLCSLFGIPHARLAEVRDSSGEFGEAALPDGVRLPIRGVLGDSQASLLAHGGVNVGDAKATFGTGTSVLLNVGSRPPEITPGLVVALAWVLEGEPSYAMEGIINFSAATLNWLRDQLGLFRDLAEAESLARSVPDNGGVTLVPAFAGLGVPHWAADAKAVIAGLTAHSTRAHVARAAYESIGFQIADALACMRDGSGVSPARLCVDGGPTRSAFLMGLTASLCGLPLHVHPQPELSPVGAVFAGCIGEGRLTPGELGRERPAELTVFEPDDDADCRAALTAQWHQAVARALHRI